MTHDKIRAAYEAVGDIPHYPFERTWCDRLRTFDAFMERGPEQADAMRKLIAITSRERVDRNMRSLCPPLFDLLMRAFPR